MKEMSDYITMLENLPDLEGSIIRSTSIYKVLKQILKKTIPRESEFNFKSRSQALLDKYLKAMAADPAPAEAPTNGVSKESGPVAEKKPEASEKKEVSEEPAADASIVKDEAEKKVEVEAS